MTDYIYDIESYPNAFTLTMKQAGENCWWTWEISERRNDIDYIMQALISLRNGWIDHTSNRMVGFNNLGYDYPVLHYVINQRPSAYEIYQKSMSIIQSDDRFGHIIWDRDQFVPQVDLYRIHHFDNKAKTTGLKMLEFNMRSHEIQDLPFPPGTVLTPAEIDELIRYNRKDVAETEKFYNHSLKAIRFREELSEKYGVNMLNFNDTKIGKKYFVLELERAGVQCYGENGPIQTPRPHIRIADIILHHIRFWNPEFDRVLTWLKSQVVTETKGVFKDLHCTVEGFRFDFGTGGIHGSVESQTVQTDESGVIVDLDVTSYYPSLAIVNRFYPAHLGPTFCDIYADVKRRRLGYAKGTTENAVLKLALNGTFGDTNNPYSPFYDPQYTMAITINGQLLLCMLSEKVMAVIPGLQMIQVNTDGITVKCPHGQIDTLRYLCRWWQLYTGMELEEARYSRMFIRDVNNYLAEYPDGKLKHKGAYAYKLAWHQNQSALVVPMAAEAALVRGENIRRFILGHQEPMDFMLRTKVPRSSRLFHGDRQVQNITRYYISHDGQPLVKMMPPLSGKTEDRRIGINVGWLTTECNRWNGRLDGINYEWYIEEAEKLVKPLRR